jgi:hypothetical protein
VISAPTFVRYFGDPKPHPQGARRNIFGSEDELKVAPKGIAKTHEYASLYYAGFHAEIYEAKLTC